MNSPFSQAARLGKLHTDLGTDKLVLLRFSGTDHVNDLYEYRVEALSNDPKVDFDAIVGTHASVELSTYNGDPCWFDGIVTTARWAGVAESGNRYDLVLRPWFWLAGRRRNQRIFHNMKPTDILKKVMEDYKDLGSPAFKDATKNAFPELEYTVQYRESDLDFCRRIMERFGISFHFVHGQSNHTLVMSDNAESHDEVPGGSREYLGSMGNHQSGEEHFWEWSAERNLTTGKIRLTDYDFKNPDALMDVELLGDAKHPKGKIESYDYPGDYLKQDDGRQRVAKLRVQQEQAQGPRHRALGNCMSLKAGLVFELTGVDAHGASGQRFVVLSATHSYVSDAYASGGAQSEGDSFTGSYEMMPFTTPLAPARVTRVPVVNGPQTAKVVGDGEIDCDEFGRILVRFPWDLGAAHSMRCRVSQNWASSKWGGMVIPRIGMEVVVEFLEGDPDKPLVTGCVYNGKNKPYYDLPGNKTRSVFRTDTHQGTGFNELRFEDKAGEEEIFWHAQKDWTVKVLNHATTRVDKNDISSIGRNRFHEVALSETQNIGGNMTVKVTGAKKEVFATGETGKNWEGIRELGTDLEQPVGEGGHYQLFAKMDVSVTSGQHTTVTTGENRTETVGEDMSLTVGGKRTLSITGAQSETIGEKLTVEAVDEIKFVCGGSSITLKPSGEIVIQGTNIKINGSSTIKGQAGKIDWN